MTPAEFLDQQETQALEALQRVTGDVGEDLGKVVDLPGIVDRHPALSLGAGLAAGFFAGKVLTSGGRRAVRGVIGTMVRPLLRPTLSGLGTAIAGLIVGKPLDLGSRH